MQLKGGAQVFSNHAKEGNSFPLNHREPFLAGFKGSWLWSWNDHGAVIHAHRSFMDELEVPRVSCSLRNDAHQEKWELSLPLCYSQWRQTTSPMPVAGAMREIGNMVVTEAIWAMPSCLPWAQAQRGWKRETQDWTGWRGRECGTDCRHS